VSKLLGAKLPNNKIICCTFAVGTLVLGLTACETTQRGALSQARKAYTKGGYADCVMIVDRAATYGDFSEVLNAQMIFYRGLCLDGMGRAAEAKMMYRRVITKYPTSPFSDQAAARLKSWEIDAK
jgi:hypothetical protein